MKTKIFLTASDAWCKLGLTLNLLFGSWTQKKRLIGATVMNQTYPQTINIWPLLQPDSFNIFFMNNI